MKGLMIIADGFEDTEALATLDVIRRAKIECDKVSVTTSKQILTQSGNIIMADKTLEDIDYKSYDFLIVPGGKAVFSVLDKKKSVDEIVSYFVMNNKLSCYICAASHLPGKNGFLKDKNYTCFPGCNDYVIGGNYKPLEPLVIDGNIITCRAMAYSIDFGLAIIEKLIGKNYKDKIEKSIKGLI